MDIYKLVVDFQTTLLKNKPYFGLPDDKEAKFIVDTLQEELDELQDSFAVNDYEGMADALIDLIYFALGHSYRMGFDFNASFKNVHEANMQKQLAKTNRGEVDASKPSDWQEPVIEPLLKIPALFIKAAEVQAKKDKDYNNKSNRKDYFPFGLKSYVQMMYIKILRMVNVLDNDKTFNEPLHDSVIDLANYASFLYDEIKEDE